jgi:hypothetical protein
MGRRGEPSARNRNSEIDSRRRCRRRKEMAKVRLIKMLGLAGVTALVAMAFVGAATASADSACLEDPKGGAQGECPEGKIWTGPIFGLAAEVTIGIPGAADTVCKGEFLADWVKNEGKKIGVVYLILTFTLLNCTGGCVFKRMEAENLPWELLILMAEQSAEGGKEHAFLREDGKGRPAILLENCTIDSTVDNCLYEFEKVVLLNYVLEEKESKPLVGAFRINTGLTRGGDSPLCPMNGVSFEGTYLTYEDLKENKEGGELFFTAIP